MLIIPNRLFRGVRVLLLSSFSVFRKTLSSPLVNVLSLRTDFKIIDTRSTLRLGRPPFYNYQSLSWFHRYGLECFRCTQRLLASLKILLATVSGARHRLFGLPCLNCCHPSRSELLLLNFLDFSILLELLPALVCRNFWFWVPMNLAIF